MKTSPRLHNFLLAAGSSLLAVSSANAATKTWDGSEANASWATAANWTSSGVPANGDDAVFTSSSTIGYSIYLGNANRTIESITFDSTTTSTPYNINLYDANLTTARTLTLGAGGVTVAAGNHTITSAYVANTTGYLKLSNNTAFDIAAGASLDLNARMTHTSTGNNYTKTGLGTLILSQNNGGTQAWQFDGGGFTVSEGVLRFNATRAFGLTGNKYVISSGAGLELTGGFVQTINAGTIRLNGTGIGGAGAIRSLSGNNTIEGNAVSSIILDTASSIGVDADTLTIGKDISGSNSLTKVGDGTLVLTATNTYTGDTTVNEGTLLLNGSTSASSAVSVSGGAIGGSGSILSTLSLSAGSFHVVDLFDALQVAGTVSIYAGFGVDDLVGLDWSTVANGTYTLIDGTLGGGVFDLLNNNSSDTAYDAGFGRTAYFREGSLQLVVIPEPSVALLGGLGFLALFRRRR